MLIFVLIALAQVSSGQDLPDGPVLVAGGAIDPYHPDFEFAPTSGLGMGTVCQCIVPSGVIGQTTLVSETFARASSATCLKAATATGIQPGDMVTCSVDKPRVMYGNSALPVDGVLGQLSEAQRINSTPQSEALNNALWGSNASVTVVTITADQALAPNGTLTADRIQVPAVNAGQFSQVFAAAGGCPSGTKALSMFLQGNGTSGTIDAYSGATCGQCSFDSSSIKRCSLVLTDPSNGLAFGNISGIQGCAGGARLAQDLFVWGIQCELGPYSTSYIPTTTVAVTRAAETGDIPVVIAAGSTGISFAGTAISQPVFTGSGVLFAAFDNSAVGANLANPYWWPFSGSDGSLQIDAAGTATAAAAYNTNLIATASVRNRFSTFHTGALMNGCVNGTCAAGTASTWSGAAIARVRIGRSTSGVTDTQVVNAVVKQVCLDRSSSRCR